MNKTEIIDILSITNKDDLDKLGKKAYEVKTKYVGNKLYLRGLIEFSNICDKNCLYCGIRSGNRNIKRYVLTDEEILSSADFAYKNGYGSIVMQSGESKNPEFINRVTSIITKIKKISDGNLGITLSCGEQTEDTYKKWFDAGAHRYLLRIETSNKELYKKIHPKNKKHSFEERSFALSLIKKTGYKTGTGVMIGLPFQTIEDLAQDLIFMKELDIDMVGMGPYIEHEDTPLYTYKERLLTKKERLYLSLKMIAVLRLMMKDINIASSTALQSIDPLGREMGLMFGANIIMPNITPLDYRKSYQLYQGKPGMDETGDKFVKNLEERIKNLGDTIGYNTWGDAVKNKIILASKSPRRNDLLKQAGLSFKVIPSNIDEDNIDISSPDEYVKVLAIAKAEEIAKIYPDSWIIGADTIVVIDNMILGKPKSIDEAREMLNRLSGKTHYVFTGYAIYCMSREKLFSGVVKSDVLFKALSDLEIEWYIKTEEPFDKAGGYAVQGLGAFFIKSINGSYTNVVGLPVCEVIDCLLKENIITLDDLKC
ncbi:MAG: [FeFe] hydrogenase H-cluster radical SAM maturase HydE [Desulfobacterales bacterium]|nr:[FeFe] hydrogenase H-cluster radical SAM maturase HydE [Desulfobacterales bacterium]MBF0395224.1 [FeFe] hydrogenase H-cluster radical SAM maturase HydE [Desulfobacterales bacterium]